ncbi:MAG: polyphosphate kinase 1 [Caldilineaceae bacterium]|nr:polyphosphate kinase 1 [Caldilineaceae bacterium]
MAAYSYHFDDPEIAIVAEAVGPTPAPTQPADEPGYLFMPPVVVYEPPTEIMESTLDDLASSSIIYNRELAWLDFNWRVLAEALDERNPLLERLRFLAITASNLDEFFRKRVGGLKRQQAVGVANLNLLGWTPDYQIRLISQAVHPMMTWQSDLLLNQLLPGLEAEGMALADYGELSDEQKSQMRSFFFREIYPILTPLAVDPGHPFPFISNLSLNLAVELRDPVGGETRFARVKIPPNRARWVTVENSLRFIPLEQVIIHNLAALFDGMEIVAAHPFRVTRNADIARNEEEADDLLNMISEELRERRFAPIVRVEVTDTMPEHVRSLLLQEMGLYQADMYTTRGPLGLADLFPLADVNLPHLKFEPWTPLTHPAMAGLSRKSRPADIFAILRKGDVLVHHPYHSFATSTQLFVEAAARDPQVLAIKQTLYRTSADSPVIKALIQAAERGKQVAVLVELKARFDEERNIEWARSLEDAGVHVAYGLVGLKTHTKTTLVIREEENELRAYAHIGTGNYNPKTAGLYTDFGFLTCRPEIGADLMDLFNFLTGYSRQQHYRKLLVAPVTMRQRFLEMIETEIANALAGRPARIVAKMNALDDAPIVAKLYEASQAGVPIQLIVRGNCRLRPGLPGISENIQVTSVIGRFLEHHRIFYFENGGDPLYFMGSADWMTRNLSDRVEAIVPIEEPALQQQLQSVLDICLQDRRQGWEMLPDGRYRRWLCVDGVEGVAGIGTHLALMEMTQQGAGAV